MFGIATAAKSSSWSQLHVESLVNRSAGLTSQPHFFSVGAQIATPVRARSPQCAKRHAHCDAVAANDDIDCDASFANTFAKTNFTDRKISCAFSD
jgi:hypothetical protein